MVDLDTLWNSTKLEIIYLYRYNPEGGDALWYNEFHFCFVFSDALFLISMIDESVEFSKIMTQLPSITFGLKITLPACFVWYKQSMNVAGLCKLWVLDIYYSFPFFRK